MFAGVGDIDIDDDGFSGDEDVTFLVERDGQEKTIVMRPELVKGKTVEEALKLTNKAVMEALDGLPPEKIHCSVLAEEAIHSALEDYNSRQDDEHKIKLS